MKIIITSLILSLAFPAMGSSFSCETQPNSNWCTGIPSDGKVCNITMKRDSALFSCDGGESVFGKEFSVDHRHLEEFQSQAIKMFLDNGYKLVNCSDSVIRENLSKNCTFSKN